MSCLNFHAFGTPRRLSHTSRGGVVELLILGHNRPVRNGTTQTSSETQRFVYVAETQRGACVSSLNMGCAVCLP
ncbi:hypothetical protein TgHK011_008564 [Trichoderma gracile]|nr:hypothetical protein TgHK011_008564 [Trichoderma gracile]